MRPITIASRALSSIHAAPTNERRRGQRIEVSEATLSLGGELAVPGGAIELTGVSRHRGQEAVARFHARLGDRYREVELRVGDAALAGEVAFQLRCIDASAGSATFVLQETPRTAAEAPYGEPFDIALGARVTFSTGQALWMTGVGRLGVEVSFEDSDGRRAPSHSACRNSLRRWIFARVPTV